MAHSRYVTIAIRVARSRKVINKKLAAALVAVYSK